jgi:hypothetical protein
MSAELNKALMEFKPDDYTVRLLDAIYKVLPGAPDWGYYPSLAGAVTSMGIPADQARRAQQIASSEEIQDVLWMSRLLDTGDKGYAIFTGVRSAVNLFFGDRAQALETDKQQRNDAVLKALGIGYLAWKAFPGTVAERAAAFKDSDAGKALLYYYGAIEVALPFADNALLKGGNILESLFDDLGADQVDRLAGLAGGKDLSGVQEMLSSLSGTLRGAVDSAAPHVEPVANAAKKYLPGVMDKGDKIAGLVANAADVMPVYRLLGARLAVEASIARAAAGANS